jgi:uncharacterized membrane protein
VQLIGWAKQAQAHAEFLPPEEQIRPIQWWLRAEALVLILIPFFAATMARGMGLS